MKANLKLAIYCRVSSDEQRTGGNIHRQIEQAAVEIQRLGLLSPTSTLVHRNISDSLQEQYFVDEAYNLEEIRENTAFFDLLERCRAGDVNAIYVDNIDRIFRSRSHTVGGQIMDLLEDYEIQIHTPTGPVNNGLVLQFMSAIGAEDKKQTLRKLHIGKKYKVQNEGRPPNGRAFWGYHFDKTTNTWEVVEEEAKVVRWAAAMSTGRPLPDMPETLKILVAENPNGVSDKLIIDGLNMVGINLISYFKRSNLRDAEKKNPTGQLPRNWLSNIYRDNRYTGQHIYRLKPVAHVGKKESGKSERETITIDIPVIVSLEEWELAKASRQHRACVVPRHSVQEYLLQGLVHCSTCGSRMGTRARHHDYYKVSQKSVVKNIAKYYVCQNKGNKSTSPCTHSKHHPSELIDKKVWERVLSYIQSDILTKVKKKARSSFHLKKEVADIQSEISKMEMKTKEILQEKSKFLSLLGKELISEDDWISQKQRLEIDIKTIQGQKTKMERHSKIVMKKIADLTRANNDDNIVAMPTSNFNDISITEKRRLCNLVIHKVLLTNNQDLTLHLKS